MCENFKVVSPSALMGGQAKAAVNLKQILNAKSTMFVPSDNMVTFCIQLQLIENFQVFRDHFEIQALL